MVNRPSSLVALDDFVADVPAPSFLPNHVFRIGEGDSVGLDQFPNLRAMAFRVIGKAPLPLPDGLIDVQGMGPFALGGLIGDAHFKLMRSSPMTAEEWRQIDKVGVDGYEIETIIDQMLPLSPKTSAVRTAFMTRIREFLEIALYDPERLPAIIIAIDGLTNARLTERARVILETGIDPGVSDLWPSGFEWGRS